MGNLDMLPGNAVPAELRRSLEALLRQRLEAAGACDVAIYPDVDEYGDPFIHVDVTHRLVERPIQFPQVFAAERAARDLAWENGERRFVYVRHIYDEKQKFADER